MSSGTSPRGDGVPQHFGEAGLTHDGEVLIRRYGRVGVREAIVDGHETVGISAGIAVAADGGGDGPDGDGAITVDAALDVAQAIGCGRPGKIGRSVVASRVAVHGVGHAELQTVAQRVG